MVDGMVPAGCSGLAGGLAGGVPGGMGAPRVGMGGGESSGGGVTSRPRSRNSWA